MKINEDFLIGSKINGEISVQSCNSKNMVNKYDAELNYYLDYNTGSPVWDSNMFYCPNYIDTSVNKTWTYSNPSSTIFIIYQYDNNKNYIGHFVQNDSRNFLTVTLPNSCKFIRIAGGKTQLNTLQLEIGNEITAYSPFTYINTITDDTINNLKKSIGSYVRTTNIPNNLNAEYWAYELDYCIIGKVVFCNFIVNIKSRTSTSTDDVYFEMPFSFVDNWYFPIMKAADGNLSEELYLQPQGGTNRIKISKSIHRQYVKVNEVKSSGYFIDTQFFAFIK